MKEARIKRSDNLQLDRISTLPDELLIHILSFLTTKQAVHTCVLAKRWTNLWASVPVLWLPLKDFQIDGPDDDPNTPEKWRNMVDRFEQFVKGFVDNQEPTTLDSVHYLCHLEGWDYWAPIGWLGLVCLLKPREIRISIKDCWSLHVPNSLFSCTSLVYLKIHLNVREESTTRPASIHLPALKYLKLRAIKLHDDFTQKLFMGCPSLEYLKLTSCTLSCSSISSKVLKKLVIHHCYQIKQMQISCPDLITLYINSFFKKGISLKSMPSLTYAAIVPLPWYPYFGNHQFPVINLFDGLKNATTLCFTVHCSAVKGLKKQLEDIPNCRNFINLKKLQIGRWNMSSNFCLIACLLKHSPNLKELLLFTEDSNQSKGSIQEEPRQVLQGDVPFQHEYLETVKIYNQGSCKLPPKKMEILRKNVDRYVKEIGNIVIQS